MGGKGRDDEERREERENSLNHKKKGRKEKEKGGESKALRIRGRLFRWWKRSNFSGVPPRGDTEEKGEKKAWEIRRRGKKGEARRGETLREL